MIPQALRGQSTMSQVRCHMSISLDGFVAGPRQSPENPIGEGGMRLHQWAFATDSWNAQQGRPGGERNADSEVIDEVFANVGAYIMGRKMFGGGDGPWDESWTGWWGEDPPFHAPVFVLTNHARAQISKQGGTTFTFVTDGIESALVKVVGSPGVTHIKYRIGP
jgi:dihydrofolate reductase